jgi:hypothetical protein
VRIRDIIKDNWQDRLHIDKMVDFKGGTKTVQSRTIPNQTASEAQLQNNLMWTALPGLQQSANLQNQANTAVGNTYNPNYTNLAGNYNTTMGNVASGYQGLISGNLPSQYAANRQAALQTDLDNTIGSSINSLANRGVLNSSVTNKSLQGISNSVADTLAKNYTSDINTVSGLLGQQANQAQNALQGNAQAQQASYFQPSQLFDYAQGQYAPASNLFNTMYSGRMGSGGTTTTQSGGKGGLGGALGSVVGIGLGNSSFGKNW